MGRAILIIGAAALAVGVIVYSLIECVRTDRAATRALPKGGWIAVIILLPLLGALLWLFLGRPQGSPDDGRPVRPQGPDDDPQFLRTIDERRRRQEQAEKLRRWEDEARRGGGPDDAAGGRPRAAPGENPQGGSSAGRADGPSDDSPGRKKPPHD